MNSYLREFSFYDPLNLSVIVAAHFAFLSILWKHWRYRPPLTATRTGYHEKRFSPGAGRLSCSLKSKSRPCNKYIAWFIPVIQQLLKIPRDFGDNRRRRRRRRRVRAEIFTGLFHCPKDDNGKLLYFCRATKPPTAREPSWLFQDHPRTLRLVCDCAERG